MVFNNELKLAIYESSLDSENKSDLINIVESTTDEEILLDVVDVLESVMGDDVYKYISEKVEFNPIKKFIDKIKEIKDVKPREYDGPEKIKNYVDKNYDDIINAARIIEYEPDKIRKEEINIVTSTILGCVSTFFGGGALALISGSKNVMKRVGRKVAASIALGGLSLGMFGPVATFVISALRTVILYIRLNNDQKVFNDLVKIRSALKQSLNKDLPEETKNKIHDMISAIDDAEDDWSSRMKTTTKESALEAFKEGILTESEVLEIFSEANATTKYIHQSREEAKKENSDIEKRTKEINDKISKFNSVSDTTPSDTVREVARKKVNNLLKERYNLNDKQDENDKIIDVKTSKDTGKQTAKTISDLKKQIKVNEKNGKKTETLKNEINNIINHAKIDGYFDKESMNKEFGIDKNRTERKPGSFV